MGIVYGEKKNRAQLPGLLILDFGMSGLRIQDPIYVVLSIFIVTGT